MQKTDLTMLAACTVETQAISQDKKYSFCAGIPWNLWSEQPI